MPGHHLQIASYLQRLGYKSVKMSSDLKSTQEISTTLLQIYAGGWHHSVFTAAAKRLSDQDKEVARLTEELRVTKVQLASAMAYVEKDLAEGDLRQL